VTRYRLVAGLVAFLMAATACAADLVKVTAVSGVVEHYAPTGKQWVRSKVGAQLPPGSQVRSGKRSAAELTFPDGTRYRLAAESQVTLQTMKPQEVALARGGLFARIIRGSAVRLTGRYGTVAVRGTDVAFQIVGDKEYVRVWGGDAQYETPQGIIDLPPSSSAWSLEGARPATATNIEPERFAGGEIRPFWENVRSGVEIKAAPSAPATKTVQADRATQQEEIRNQEPGREDLRETTGNIVVDIQQAGAAASAAGGGGFSLGAGAASLLSLTALADTAADDVNVGRSLGRKMWGPYTAAQAYGLWGESGSFLGGRARLRTVYDKTLLQVSGRWETMTGSDPDFLLDETFAAWKSEEWQLLAGRSRILEGPVNNSDFGTLMPFNLTDGIHGNYWLNPRTSLSLAWIEDYDSLFHNDEQALYGRLSTYVAGGSVGIAALRDQGRGTGVVGQVSLPLLPDVLDGYAEFGDDSEGRHLETVGLYLPGLYQDHGLDLYLERAQRHGFDTLTSLNAYWELDEDMQVIGVVNHSRMEGWRFGVGFIANFGG